MKRFFIEEAKYGIGNGGVACGPVELPVVGEVKIKVNDEIIFYTLVEVCGLPNFYKTDESYFEKHIKMDIDDDDIEEISNHFVETGDYDEIEKNKDQEWYDIYRYLVYIVRSDYETCDQFIEETKGKYIDEISIPDYVEDYDLDEIWSQQRNRRKNNKNA